MAECVACGGNCFGVDVCQSCEMAFRQREEREQEREAAGAQAAIEPDSVDGDDDAGVTWAEVHTLDGKPVFPPNGTTLGVPTNG